jgi:ApaG protein
MELELYVESTSQPEAATFVQTTGEITVSVKSFYLDDQSSPEENLYVWAYHVRIENNGDEIVQLKTRHWRITDAIGNIQEIRGDGVVGEQPILKAGQSFEYTSGTPLPTPSGFMEGTYQMVSESGGVFDAGVPAFSLDSPFQATQIQ